MAKKPRTSISKVQSIGLRPYVVTRDSASGNLGGFNTLAGQAKNIRWDTNDTHRFGNHTEICSHFVGRQSTIKDEILAAESKHGYLVVEEE
ncbi:MAG: hypothetical protein AAGJ54_04840 [Planctomycetota bacterium]